MSKAVGLIAILTFCLTTVRFLGSGYALLQVGSLGYHEGFQARP